MLLALFLIPFRILFFDGNQAVTPIQLDDSIQQVEEKFNSTFKNKITLTSIKEYSKPFDQNYDLYWNFYFGVTFGSFSRYIYNHNLIKPNQITIGILPPLHINQSYYTVGQSIMRCWYQTDCVSLVWCDTSWSQFCKIAILHEMLHGFGAKHGTDVMADTISKTNFEISSQTKREVMRYLRRWRNHQIA